MSHEKIIEVVNAETDAIRKEETFRKKLSAIERIHESDNFMVIAIREDGKTITVCNIESTKITRLAGVLKANYINRMKKLTEGQ